MIANCRPSPPWGRGYTAAGAGQARTIDLLTAAVAELAEVLDEPLPRPREMVVPQLRGSLGVTRLDCRQELVVLQPDLVQVVVESFVLQLQQCLEDVGVGGEDPIEASVADKSTGLSVEVDI